MVKTEQFQPGDKVSVWGRFDPEESPEVLSVKKNGIMVMWKEYTITGKMIIAKARYPAHALQKV